MIRCTSTSTVSMGNGMPIRPVWQTRISSGEAPTPSAVSVQSRRAASRPGCPVAALALPDVRMTPAARPVVVARWPRLTWTGAAAARLAVNTPAAGTARPSSVATTATSGTPPALIPADPPAATKPSGAVTLMARPRSWVEPGCGQSGRLGKAEGRVGALHGLARGTLDQVVESAEGKDPAG